MQESEGFSNPSFYRNASSALEQKQTDNQMQTGQKRSTGGNFTEEDDEALGAAAR